MKTVITKHGLISCIAYWGIRQSPYLFPKNLESALRALEKRIDEKQIFRDPTKKSTGSYLEMDNKEIRDLIHDLIFKTPEISIWNVTQLEQDNGITDPEDAKRTVKAAFVSMHGPMQAADRDFIDLDALHQNVFGMI